VDCSINLGDLMFKKLSTLCLLLSFAAQAGLPPTTLKDQSGNGGTTFNFKTPPGQTTSLGGVTRLIETGNNNVLQNPNFQASGITSATVPNWTVLGSGVTASAYTTAPYQADPQALSLVLSAATGDIIRQDITVPSGSISNENIENSFVIYNASTTGLQVCPRIAASDITSQCVTVPTGSSWVPTSATTVGGSTSTSVGVSLYAASAVTGTVYIARGYVGQNRNIGTVAQAQFLGDVNITGCGGGWTTTSTTVADYTVQTGCSYAVTGSLSAPSTMLPGFKLSGAPGTYLVVYGGEYGNSGTSGNVFFQLYDGTNASLETPQLADGTSLSGLFAGNLTWHISEPTAFSNYNFRIRGYQANGSTNFVSGSSSVFHVYYFPASAQSVYLASSGGLNPCEESITAASSCPIGTVREDGSALSRTQYAALFNCLGSTYGAGDGSTTFNVPNAQGVFERGAGSQTIAGITYTGAPGTTQGDQMQGHIHNTSFGAGPAGVTGAAQGITGSPTVTNASIGMTDPVTDGTNGTPRTGAETRPANISHLHCIRYVPASPAPVVINYPKMFSATFNGSTCAVIGQYSNITAGNWVSSTSGTNGVCTINYVALLNSPLCTTSFINASNGSVIESANFGSISTSAITTFNSFYNGSSSRSGDNFSVNCQTQ
jgi:microcystin-dependent protein